MVAELLQAAHAGVAEVVEQAELRARHPEDETDRGDDSVDG